LFTVALAACAITDRPLPAGRASAFGDQSALPAELDRVLREYEQAWRAHDADALAALFAEDGYVLSSGRPPVHGRAAIRDAYADSGGPLYLRALHHATEGNIGWIIGVYGHQEAGPETGKFILALTRRSADAPWLIAADMDNSNRRPGEP
jgi:ketosteroid isomerase-like protein